MTATVEFKTELYREYHGKVLSYIRGKVGSSALAEDLCSDIFVKIYEKLDRYDEAKASLSTWIYTITRNTLTDYYRTRRVFSEIPEAMEDGFSMEEDLCSREMLETLAEALEHLDERSRDIIILRYYSGQTLKEIAERLHISYAYVKVLHSKALSSLRTFF